MYAESSKPVYSKALADAMLSALKTAPAGVLLTSPKIHLAMGSFNPQPTDDPATYTETNFSGYSADTFTLSAPVNLASNVDGVVANAMFLAAAATPFVSANVTGYYVTDTTGAILYLAEAFRSPIPIARAGDFIDLAIAFPQGLIQPAQ